MVGSGGGWEVELREEEEEREMGVNIEFEAAAAAVEVEMEPGPTEEKAELRWEVEVELEVELRSGRRAAWRACESKSGVEETAGNETRAGIWLSGSGPVGSCGIAGGDCLMVLMSQPRCSPRLLRVMKSPSAVGFCDQSAAP